MAPRLNWGRVGLSPASGLLLTGAGVKLKLRGDSPRKSRFLEALSGLPTGRPLLSRIPSGKLSSLVSRYASTLLPVVVMLPSEIQPFGLAVASCTVSTSTMVREIAGNCVPDPGVVTGVGDW